jgi:hypothetical protein
VQLKTATPLKKAVKQLFFNSFNSWTQNKKWRSHFALNY